MSKKEVFILNATIEKPEGIVEQLNAKEALLFMGFADNIGKHLTGTVTITWIEGSPEQILNILSGYPYFEEDDPDYDREFEDWLRARKGGTTLCAE
jgi:hypothetical protein